MTSAPIWLFMMRSEKYWADREGFMIFAMIENDGKEQLCCVDKAGCRAFPINEFFERDLKEYCIDSNRIGKIPGTMGELIERYNALWADDMALFFGSNPKLAIPIDSENDWFPVIRPEEIWSPLEEARGISLLE